MTAAREIKPLVEAYFAWVHEQDPATIVSKYTRDGLNYSINQEKYLKVFLEDGNIPIDNSATERAIHPFTIGRANWHIIDTIHGAEPSAVIYSLVETAKANKSTGKQPSIYTEQMCRIMCLYT